MIKNLKYKKYLIMPNIKEKILKDRKKDTINRVRMENSSAIYLISMRHNPFMKIIKL
jgi:hypothetical protein